MSNQPLEGMMLNRLLVLIQIVAIPTYFTFFSILWNEEITEFFEHEWLEKILPNWLIWFEINLAIPIFFSLPWVIITIMRATKIANSYTLMGRALGKVRIDQKLFYGLNAAFTMIFLVLPFASPILTVLGVFIAFRILTRKAIIGRISKLFWFIPALIISIIPGLIVIAFYSNYRDLFDKIFEIWQDYIDDIFYMGLCLALAISIGNFFYFLHERRKKFSRTTLDPYRLIYLLKFVFFGFLLYLYLDESIDGVSTINLINIFAAVLAAIEFILRRINDIHSESSGANLMVYAFIFINFITNQVKRYISIEVFRALLIVVSGLIFFILFALSYRYAEDEELFD
ncbi:MAG: hypothetical protein ACXAD7_00200 [Candidatus Kariarchaeaceae archaeon]|jgi:hypothetical protein